jgi:hypothetical protein
MMMKGKYIMKIMQANEIGSTYTFQPGGKGKAVYKTLDNGQYAIAAKNIVMENAKTGDVVELGDATPISSKELFEYNMMLPANRLNKTLPGIVGDFFGNRGTFSDKDQWTVKFKV